MPGPEADRDRDRDEYDDEDEGAERKKQRTGPIRKLTIRMTDQSKERQEEVVGIANQALDEYALWKDVAAYIKRALDDKYPGSTWHAYVGTSFGASTTHEAGTMISFQLDRVSFIVFCSGPPTKSEHQQASR
eukprot:TRINITY_DN49872_c0_g1_i1.p1 TRINITY_DN49872_c0_g1~~TRINITY_DN49872_c0_g1_i1.p1  ORF type:complete len:132 (-),score=7.23 TRINITY_DN49872_c0_g1_i1:140-535(-)